MTGNTFSNNAAILGGALWAGGDIDNDEDLARPTDFLVDNDLFVLNRVRVV